MPARRSRWAAACAMTTATTPTCSVFSRATSRASGRRCKRPEERRASPWNWPACHSGWAAKTSSCPPLRRHGTVERGTDRFHRLPAQPGGRRSGSGPRQRPLRAHQGMAGARSLRADEGFPAQQWVVRPRDEHDRRVRKGIGTWPELEVVLARPTSGASRQSIRRVGTPGARHVTAWQPAWTGFARLSCHASRRHQPVRPVPRRPLGRGRFRLRVRWQQAPGWMWLPAQACVRAGRIWDSPHDRARSATARLRNRRPVRCRRRGPARSGGR